MSPARVVEKLSPGWQAVIAIGGMVSFGLTVGLALAGWIQLPEKVEEDHAAIMSLQENDARQSKKLDRIDCVLTAMARKRDPLDECGM